MSETKTQWFVLYGGLFIPIVDNVVRDGYYIMDLYCGGSAYSALSWLGVALGGIYVNSAVNNPLHLGGEWLMALPAENCGQLLRVDYGATGNLEIMVELST